MTQPQEKLACQIAAMSRPSLVKMLRLMNCDFRIDFSDDFLKSCSLERLRHIVLAASLHAHNAAALTSAQQQQRQRAAM